MKTGFLFLLQTIYYLATCIQIPRAIGAFYHVWKGHNVQWARSEMRRCTSHVLYRSKLWQPEPSLDCHEWQRRAQADENKISCYGYGLWCGFKWRPHHATSHLRSRLESQHQSVPGCAEDPGCGSKTRRRHTSPNRPRLGFRRSATTLCPSLIGPLLPRPETSGLLRLVIRRYHHQHDLPQQQTSQIAAIRRIFIELPLTIVEKACSEFQIRIKAVIEAEGGYIE